MLTCRNVDMREFVLPAQNVNGSVFLFPILPLYVVVQPRSDAFLRIRYVFLKTHEKGELRGFKSELQHFKDKRELVLVKFRSAEGQRAKKKEEES